MDNQLIKTVSDGQWKPMPVHPAEKLDRLIGALQERFGYSRERAMRELQRRLAKHHPRGALPGSLKN